MARTYLFKFDNGLTVGGKGNFVAPSTFVIGMEDIDLEIRELLLDLEAREKDNLMRSKVNKRVLKVSRWKVYFFWWIFLFFYDVTD